MLLKDCYIEDRQLLDIADFARAEKLIADGMSFQDALQYLRGWARDAAFEAYCETSDARDHEERSY